ncbi:uncharacterized protein LOC119679529 isoform X2 [Teleopsis dalmanni]|uniref:uncharacterized protein LOC119679529 isoform X2 n=1 Tax=Teleopsis dalmanni TaxID=139649 RepID=UPI0018CFDB53|nr:uncharacterized protein LOC119679529 isoform X2 [Teleopsis dalmanni]
MMEWLPRGLPSIHAPIPICVPPKTGQKRPATSPAPLIPSPHHLQSSGTANSGTTASNVVSQAASNLLNHGLPTNHMGAQSPSLTQHQVHQQAVAAAAAAAQVQQQLAGVSANLNPNASGGRGSFAAALRNLAKQADIKEDEDGVVRERNERTSSAGGVQPSVGVPNTNTIVTNSNQSRSTISNDRLSSSVVSAAAIDDRSIAKKRSAPSPQPPEKIARLNPPQAASIQPELLARSGFQPYRSDERLLHPAGAFPLEAYSPFGAFPGMPPGAFLNPASLPYSEQLYLDQRYQMLRAAGAHHSHPHALYPQIAPSYASHLYSMIPGATLGLGPALHERLKLEEEHRARIAREEEREREMQREKERELREQREREQREKEQREREQREKEQREKEQKEKEAREREMREKEREARERERQQLLTASHHYSNTLYSPLNRNLLGSMIPHLNLGLRAPPGGIHSLPAISPYHAATQRQSPHNPMGLNLGLSGLAGVPSLSHGPPNLPHHLQQAALGLAHPAAAGLTHPGFSAAALGLTHHSLSLGHPHISPHHPVITSAHQMPSHSSAVSHTSTATTSPHNSVNISASSALPLKLSESNSITSLAPSITTSSSAAQQSSSHIPSMNNALYYAHPSHHLAAMHAASALTPTAAHQHSPAPLSLSLNQVHSHTSSPTGMKIPTPASSGGHAVPSGTNAHNPNNGRTSSSPHAMRHHSVIPTTDKPNTTPTTLATTIHEPTTLDLTGSNSNSSNQAPSTASSTGQGLRTTPSIAHEINGVESNQEMSKDISKKEDTLKSSTPPTTDKKPPTPTSNSLNTAENILPSNSTEEIRRSSPNSATQLNVEPKTSILTTVSGTTLVAGADDAKPTHSLNVLGRNNSTDEASVL